MNNVELIRFTSAEELATRAAADWLDLVAAARAEGRDLSVALSGGRITKTFFAETVRLAGERGENLGNVHFFWADERCVPPDDTESNYRMANELLFLPLQIGPEKIHRIEGETEPGAAAERACAELRAVLPEGDTPSLDVVFLGMGEDGHVASLFPEENEFDRDKPDWFRAVTATKPPPQRITMGYPLLIAARDVRVLASGAGKEAALRKALSPDSPLPLGRVLRGRNHSRVLTDVDAEA